MTIVGLCVLLLALVISFFVVTRYKDKTEKEAETKSVFIKARCA